MNLITSHLGRLFDFSGRENRKPFWLWLLTVYLTQMAVTIALIVPLSIGMASKIQALQQYDQSYLDAHPEVASRVVMDTVVPFFRYFIVIIGAIVVLQVVLVASAVVRRLHDTNRSGYWALPQLILQLIMLGSYAVVFPRLFSLATSIQPGAGPEAVNAMFGSLMPLFALTWLAGMVGFIYGIVMLVFLVSRGTVGPNRYGEDLLPPPMVPQWQPPPQQWQQPQWQQPQWQQPQWQQPQGQPPQWQQPQPPAWQPPPPPPPARIVGPGDEPTPGS